MSVIRDGVPASPGIVAGPAYVLRWDTPRVPHITVDADRIEEEIERFAEARAWSKGRIAEIQRQTAERLGPVEAQIFEPHATTRPSSRRSRSATTASTTTTRASAWWCWRRSRAARYRPL
jgi:phosphoenolpyruvate-protein kinase (PTS system EI component)